MLEFTSEQRQEIRDAGEGPVSFSDTETKTDYLVLKAEVYERLQRAYEEIEPSLYEFEEIDAHS